MKKQSLYIAAAALVLASCASTGVKKSTEGYEAVSKEGSAVPYQVLLKTADGVEIQNGGYGSDACAHPTDSSLFYLITDRGPNIDYTGEQGKGKLFPVPEYSPRIGLFRMEKDGSVSLVKEIILKTPEGKSITGLPNP